MNEAEQLAALLREAVEGHPYYGPSIITILRSVTAEMATATPSMLRHSIWEILAHVTSELQYAVTLLDGTAEAWIEGETTWPAVSDKSERAWQAAVNQLKATSTELCERIAALSNDLLDQECDRAKTTYRLALHGTIQHCAYHAGQLGLLTRADSYRARL